MGVGWLRDLGACFRKKLAESWFIAFGVGYTSYHPSKRRRCKHVKEPKAVAGPSPCNGKGPMHICNGASVAVVKRAFCKFENAVAPLKNPKLADNCAPKKFLSVQKLRHALPKNMLVLQRGRGCRKPQSMAIKDRCQRAVVVPSKCIKTIATGEQQKIAHKPRTYEKHYSPVSGGHKF